MHGMKMSIKFPSHPGEIIREEVIQALNLDVKQAAEILQVARPTLSKLLNEKSALSPEMAIRIEKAFGPKADHLLKIQASYDLAKARQHADAIQVKPYRPPA